MEYLFMVLGSLLFLLGIWCWEAYKAKRTERKFIEDLYHRPFRLADKSYTADRLEKINGYYLKHKKEGSLDDITWNDLGMDDLFLRMNYTLSASGEEYLYYRLRTPYRDLEKIQHFESLVSYFAEHPDQRVRVQFRLKRLGYTGKYSLYDYIDHLEDLGERSNTRHHIGNLLFLVCILLLFVQFTVGVLGLVALMIYNLLSYFKDKAEIEPYIISFAYLLRLMEAGEQLAELPLEGCQQELAAIRENLRSLQGMRRNSFWILFDSKTATSSGDIISGLLDYVKMLFHVDVIKFNQMLGHLRGHRSQVDGLIRNVGYLETTIAVGIFRESLDQGWCKPTLLPEERGLELEEGYHPLLQEPVKNSIQAKKGVLLTGSNASGKSTFLKTVALNAVMAQAIHTCTGSRYQAGLYEIYTSMALRDDLAKGESYFIVEIKALKRIMDHSGGRVLCFVDEVLRGTNTVERIAASTQILSGLVDRGILCFAATHDIELTELLQQQYDNYHFRETIVGEEIQFPYKLYPGKATSRNAILLLQLLGYQESLIEEAQKRADRFLETGTWSP